jgi:hypothetical protein
MLTLFINRSIIVNAFYQRKQNVGVIDSGTDGTCGINSLEDPILQALIRYQIRTAILVGKIRIRYLLTQAMTGYAIRWIVGNLL